MPASRTTDSSARRAARERPARMTARDLALVAAFTALIVVLGLPGALYPLGGAVPITLQSFGVMLAGALLGWRRGVAAVLLLLGLCLVGLPVLAGGRGGPGVFISPTVGYLVGYVAGVAVIGGLAQRRAGRFSLAWTLMATVLGGIVVVHGFGVVGMMWRAGLDLPKALAADLLFVPGDLVKAVLAALVAQAVHRAVPGLLLPRRRPLP